MAYPEIRNFYWLRFHFRRFLRPSGGWGSSSANVTRLFSLSPRVHQNRLENLSLAHKYLIRKNLPSANALAYFVQLSEMKKERNINFDTWPSSKVGKASFSVWNMPDIFFASWWQRLKTKYQYSDRKKWWYGALLTM